MSIPEWTMQSCNSKRRFELRQRRRYLKGFWVCFLKKTKMTLKSHDFF